MPLIKVAYQSVSKLIKAENYETLKTQCESKFSIEIDKFFWSERSLEISDNKTFLEVINQSEPCLIPIIKDSPETFNFSVKVSLLNDESFQIIKGTDLESLKSNIEDKLKMQIVKLVRKSDGAEIEDNEILLNLVKSTKDLWLIAILDDDEEYGLISHEDVNVSFSNLTSNIRLLDTVQFELKKKELEEKKNKKLIEEEKARKRLEELYSLTTEIQTLEENKKIIDNKIIMKSVQKERTDTKSKSFINTAQFELRKKELEDEKNKKQLEKEKARKRLEDLSTLTTEVKNLIDEKNKYEEEYDKKLKETIKTKHYAETELAKEQAKLVELNLNRKRIANIFYELKQAERVDICFLVDCTGSMGPYINQTKKDICEIVNKLRNNFEDFKLRMSFVGYRDHTDGDNRLVIFNFNSDIDKFKAFISEVKDFGGGDQCEDVFGGLEAALNLEWLNATRVLMHIADAPCHGKRFHDLSSDQYPTGDPRGLDLTNLLNVLIQNNIEYYFEEINSSTLKMIQEFDKELIKLGGNKICLTKLSSVNDLGDSVFKSISKAISKTKAKSLYLSKSKDVKKIPIDSAPLNWDKSKMKKHRAIYYQFKYNGTVDEIKEKELDCTKNEIDIWISETPFSKGALRYAYSALTSQKLVLKESISNAFEYNTESFYKEMLENQVIAAYLANNYFDQLKSFTTLKTRIRFLDVGLIYLPDKDKYYTVEEFLDGDFQKWNNNAGEVNQEIYSCTLNAFSHWTYQITKEYLIVNDLQGMVNMDPEKREYILTDPAIICPEHFKRFSNTNLGIKGIEKFFTKHQCNNICKKLGLKRHKYQIKPDIDMLVTNFKKL